MLQDFLDAFRRNEGADQMELPLDEPKGNNKTFIAVGIFVLTLCFLLLFAPLVFAQGMGHNHPQEHAQLHYEFYKDWKRPDTGSSCCNRQDCAPVQIKYIDGVLHLQSQWTGKWLPVPEAVIDREAVPPDGRNHGCVRPPMIYDHMTLGAREEVLCFAFGIGI